MTYTGTIFSENIRPFRSKHSPTSIFLLPVLMVTSAIAAFLLDRQAAYAGDEKALKLCPNRPWLYARISQDRLLAVTSDVGAAGRLFSLSFGQEVSEEAIGLA